MHGEAIVAAGPYRYLRNPLYLGTFVHTFALALLMPPSGAIFSIFAIGLFELRLIAGRRVLPHRQTRRTLSRLLRQSPPPHPRPLPASPRLHPSTQTGLSPSLARSTCGASSSPSPILGWRYNSILIIKGVLISLGLSLDRPSLHPKTLAPVPDLISLVSDRCSPSYAPENNKPAAPKRNRAQRAHRYSHA